MFTGITFSSHKTSTLFTKQGCLPFLYVLQNAKGIQMESGARSAPDFWEFLYKTQRKCKGNRGWGNESSIDLWSLDLACWLQERISCRPELRDYLNLGSGLGINGPAKRQFKLRALRLQNDGLAAPQAPHAKSARFFLHPGEILLVGMFMAKIQREHK